MTNRLSLWSSVVMVALGALALGGALTLMPPTPVTFLGFLALPALVFAFRRIPELALTLFLYAGFFKQAVPIPGDVTLLLAATAMILAVYLAGRHGLRPVPLAVWMFVGFVVIVAVGAGYSQEVSYGIDKAARLATLGLITPLVTVQIVRDRDSVERLAWSMLGFGLVMSIVAIVAGGDPRFYGKLAAFGSDTIALGRVAGYATAIAAVSALRSVRHAVYAAPVMAICGFALLGSGSRGPLLGLVAAFAVLFIARLFSGGAGRIVIVALIASLLLVVALGSGTLPASSLAKVARITTDVQDADPTRTRLLGQAYELFEDDPLTGAGTGSYAAYDSKFDYPHDLVLEVAAENGIVAVVLTLGFLGLALTASVVDAAKDSRFASGVVVVLVVAATVNALVSSDINGNRVLFALVAVAATHAAHIETTGTRES